MEPASFMIRFQQHEVRINKICTTFVLCTRSITATRTTSQILLASHSSERTVNISKLYLLYLNKFCTSVNEI
jgi:hypothetical protein